MEGLNKCSPVVDDEVREHELMRVEQEWRNAQREDGDPEVQQVGCPQRQRYKQQHEHRPHAEVDTWASETREEDVEVDACCRKATSGRNVTSTTESEIAQNRVGVDLGGEDLEDGRKRAELLSQTEDCLPCSSLNQF